MTGCHGAWAKIKAYTWQGQYAASGRHAARHTSRQDSPRSSNRGATQFEQVLGAAEAALRVSCAVRELYTVFVHIKRHSGRLEACPSVYGLRIAQLRPKPREKTRVSFGYTWAFQVLSGITRFFFFFFFRKRANQSSLSPEESI